jgi:hypothetical protein
LIRRRAFFRALTGIGCCAGCRVLS